MLVHVTRQPHGTVDGLSLRHYRVCHTYDLEAPVAEILVLYGYGRFEMRQDQRSRRTRENDRRRRR
jgi:hypothetical protein